MTLDEALQQFDAAEFFDRVVAETQIQMEERSAAMRDMLPRCPAMINLMVAFSGSRGENATEKRMGDMLAGAVFALAHLCRMAEVAELEGDPSTKESDK